MDKKASCHWGDMHIIRMQKSHLVLNIRNVDCKSIPNRYQMPFLFPVFPSAGMKMFCTWSVWEKTIVILTAPHSGRHVNDWAMNTYWWGGRWWEASERCLFEVGIWLLHLHLMPFRLRALTRAKHLARLGLIWWGHAVTLWPIYPYVL